MTGEPGHAKYPYSLGHDLLISDATGAGIISQKDRPFFVSAATPHPRNTVRMKPYFACHYQTIISIAENEGNAMLFC